MMNTELWSSAWKENFPGLYNQIQTEESPLKVEVKTLPRDTKAEHVEDELIEMGFHPNKVARLTYRRTKCHHRSFSSLFQKQW
ncbi:hypothetical protein NPIL_192791 [Nephila pilipes]|uniref:Uncharacterized protein n=2 Tax=Nephila pilipes TaxID=299642 RepID=A0A8X6K028_NEPPI|nr:hypothetical protein NPIL_192791 [Nephila pilipes]